MSQSNPKVLHHSRRRETLGSPLKIPSPSSYIHGHSEVTILSFSDVLLRRNDLHDLDHNHVDHVVHEDHDDIVEDKLILLIHEAS